MISKKLLTSANPVRYLCPIETNNALEGKTMNTKAEMNTKEFKEGYAADAKARNPYRSGTYQYDLWRDGRIEATLQGR